MSNIILCMQVFLFANLAFGKPWVISSSSQSAQLDIDELHKKFPDISSPEDLSRLLQAISLAAPMAELTAEDSAEQIIIKFVSADIINEIKVTSFTRSIRLEVESKINKYLSQADSQEIRQQISDEIFKILKNQGYYLAKVQVSPHTRQGGIAYEIVIDEDYPCTIAQIDLGFKLPLGFFNPFQKGMYCDAEDISNRLTQLENDLVKAGFNQQRIQSPEIKFDPASNTAKLIIKGSLGKKIHFRINSPIKTPGFITLIFGDDLNTLDPTITDPDAMSSELTRQYKAQGFDDVEISTPRITQPDSETIEYQFEVKPGPEYLIADVQFEGLISFSQEEAAEIMNLSTKFGNKPIFNQELTRQARDVLVNRYKDRGYWDAKIFDPRVIKNPGTSEVKLVYVIKEGKRRLFEDLIVSGNKAMSVADISQILKTSEKEPLAWQQLIEFEKELRASYRLLGYLQVDMNIELVQNRQFRDIETRILLTIQEGPRARFGEITVKGLVKTDADIVTRELRFKSGDWYDPLAIEESRQALVDLGLFSSVSITPSDSNPSGKNAIIAYTVYLREARSGSVSFGPGWSLADGMRFSIEGSYNNIGGRGRKIFSKGTLSEEKNQAPLGDKTLLGRYTGVGYLEPYLFNYPVDGTLTFNHKALARAQSWEISRSAEAIASHRIRGLSPRTDLSLFTLYKETREEAEAGIRRATLMESGNLQVREIGIRHTTDARNNKGWPTRGYRLVTEFSTADFVFGGDLKYTRWSMNYNIYRELRTNFVIAAGIGFTSYNNILRHNAPNVLPTSERLPSGGPESNRGFRDNSLGPVFITTDNAGKSLEIYDGGSRRGSQRLELRYQAVQDTFAVTSFIDASNSFFSSTEENLIRQEFSRSASADTKSPEFYDNQPYELDTLIRHPNYIWTRNYVSYGLSGNLLTPLGSANISFGWPWRRCLNNSNDCAYPRGNSNYRQLRGAVLGINVGANF